MASIHEVAKLAGVSASTVSRVINRTRYVSPEIRARVLKAIEDLNFQPSTAARNLRLQQTQIIGVLLPGLEDYFFGSMAAVIEKTLLAHNYRPLFCSTENSPNKEADYLRMLTGQRVDGVLMVPASSSGETLDQVRAVLSRDTPLVLMDNGLTELPVSQVLPNNRQGGYLAAQHLLELGHREIAIVLPGLDHQPPTSGGGHERLVGMQQAYADYGLPGQPRLIIDDFPYVPMGYQGVRMILADYPQVTAIFAITDQVAIGVLRGMWDRGIRAPHDFSVMGYGNIPLTAHLIPRLTTVAQHLEDMGRLAAEKLLEEIQQPESPVQTISLATELIIRESTAAPRTHTLPKFSK